MYRFALRYAASTMLLMEEIRETALETHAERETHDKGIERARKKMDHVKMQFLLLSFGCLSVFFSLADSKSYNAQPSNVLKRGYRPSSVAEFRPVNNDDEYAVGDDQTEATYNNEDYTAVDIAPAPDSNYDKKPGGNAGVYYPTDDYRVSRDYDDYVSPQACGYDANGTLCGFNCSYGSNYYYYECDSVYQRCTYDRLGQMKCKYTVGVNVGSLCSINDKGEYFCGDYCEFTSTSGDSISCKSTILQCKFTDDSLVSCKFNTTYVYPQKCEVVQSSKTQICGYNCTYSEDGADMKCKDTYQTCQLTDDNEYVCEYEFDVDSDSCTKDSRGNWKCNGLDCEKNKKKLVCTQKTSYYYYDDARVRGIEFEGCGQSSYGDMQICGSNCTHGYQGYINCSVISKICNYNGNAYLMGDSKGQCMYNTQTVQADLCGMNAKGDNICGYNCSYAAANSSNIKCEKVYQTCGYDADDTYHCKYAPDYVMPSSCGNDPDGNSICGQECSYVIDEELMCKYIDYKCNYQNGRDYWCLYNRSNTAEDYCDKEDGKWVCQDGCYVDKEKNVWCYENSTQTSYDHQYPVDYYYVNNDNCYYTSAGTICTDDKPEGIDDDFFNRYMQSITYQYLLYYYQYNYQDGDKISLNKLYTNFLATTQLWMNDTTLDEKKAHFDEYLDSLGSDNKEKILRALEFCRDSISDMSTKEARKYTEDLVSKFDNGDLFTDIYTIIDLAITNAESQLSYEAYSDYIQNGPVAIMKQVILKMVAQDAENEQFPYIHELYEWYRQDKKAAKKCKKLDCESDDQACDITYSNGKTTAACVPKDSVNQNQCEGRAEERWLI
ncbi:hypothetical protein WR25_12107 isoform A [Diploscapter pachys]|uniref:Uncharacterized protein n=1 Tax=Diploscapter pachys TaxID=2018661 RepID=A0A2A2JGY1_9BILA|nr:hypothetical protein WR25_12107 isoform A [Diploscapter pachys]